MAAAWMTTIAAWAVGTPGLAAAAWPSWLLFGFLVLVVGALIVGCWQLAGRTLPRERLAQRADCNGRALLALADEIEEHLLMQRLAGANVHHQQHWPRLCRRLAMEHLECINRLMFENPSRE